MAILRSRGASTLQVVGISLLQGILLGAVARRRHWSGLLDHTLHRQGACSFLDFSAAGGLRVSMTPQVLGLWSAWHRDHSHHSSADPDTQRAENTIVTYKQERARSLRVPWWQRYWLDVLLLIPAAYGLWQLLQQSKQALEGVGSNS